MKIKEQRNDNLVKHWTFCGLSVCVDVIILLIRNMVEETLAGSEIKEIMV